MQTNTPTQLLLSATQAARALGISRTTLYGLHSSGRLGPLPVKLGRRTLWSVDELKRWVEAGCPPRDKWRPANCQGYLSQSTIWEASQRLIEREQQGQNSIILYLGDHDPSGIDMTRDIQSRLNLFGSEAEVKRIALNLDQIEQYQPPPNPTKITDTRSDEYIRNYGGESWELDALDPKVITGLIRDNVAKYTNDDKQSALVELQETYRKELQYVALHWTEINGNKEGK